MAHGLVRGLGGLALVRAMLGLGEAGFYPAAMKGGVAGWFAPKDRAKAVGLFLSALSVGTLLTAADGGVDDRPVRLAQLAFVATGSVGILLLPPWLILHRVFARRTARRTRRRRRSRGPTLSGKGVTPLATCCGPAYSGSRWRRAAARTRRGIFTCSGCPATFRSSAG